MARKMIVGSGGSRTFPPVPAPTIVSISPDNGAAAGGTTVTITMDFVPSGAAIAVTFGGDSATVTATRYGENGTITCTSPAHAVGEVDVVVSHVYGVSQAQNVGGFTYTQASLTAGTATVTAGDTEASLSATAPTGGTAPYTYQWYRSTTGGQKGASLGASFQSLTETDTGLSNGTTYYYTLDATDSAGSPATVSYTQRSATPGSYAAANIFSHNFDDGTFGGLTPNVANTSVVGVIDDPTPRALGKVLRIWYPPTGGNDVNRFVQWQTTAPGYEHGTNVYCRAKLFLPTSATYPNNMRKLFYFNVSLTGSGPWGVLKTRDQVGGNAKLQFETESNGVVTFYSNVGSVPWDTWTSLEVQFGLNSADGAADGIFRLWVNGALTFERTNIAYIKAAHTIGLRRIAIGHQWEGSVGQTVDENRYWDDIAISTQRIGPG